MLTTEQFLTRVVTASKHCEDCNGSTRVFGEGGKEYQCSVCTGGLVPISGYFLLAFGNNGTAWQEEWFNWPDDLQAICTKAAEAAEHTNVYFSTYLFKERSSTKPNVLPSRTIQADLDEAQLTTIPIPPTVLIRTSPGRHQGYWILDELLEPEVHEILSRKVTYSIPGCDHSGWPLGRKVRVANSNNYKYLSGPKPVEVVGLTSNNVSAVQLELLPEAPKIASEAEDDAWLKTEHTHDTGPNALLETIKDSIPAAVYVQYNVQQSDRSAALWALMCAAFRAGLQKDDVFWLAKHSANNKFTALKYHADRELGKDVLRAQAIATRSNADPREVVASARKLKGSVAEKNQYIAKFVQQWMSNEGQFVHSIVGNAWYIRNDVGRPIAVARRSQYLNILLDLEFGLNPTESETRYVAASLENHVYGLPQRGIEASLSYYDEANKRILFHSGRKEVLEITSTETRTVTDGAYDVIFQWPSILDVLHTNVKPIQGDWAVHLFGNVVENVLEMPRAQAQALLKVWFLFLLFRDAATARPILTLLGQPGSGKSTTFRKIYALLYGRRKALGGVSTQDDFDHAVAHDPLVVLDNVDTWERWLPDRMAQSAATSDLTKRKLYTDSDVITLRRQALLAVSAHNPHFGREDVADRLLLMTLQRLSVFVPEREIVAQVLKDRSALWASIFIDVQKVLNTAYPTLSEVPQIRVEDFAFLGFWIARALNCEDDFSTGIQSIRRGQKAFALEEESLLTTALFVTIQNHPMQWYTHGQLFPILELSSGDAVTFGKYYKNAVFLGKKLWALQDALKEQMLVEFKYDSMKQQRMWRFGEKPSDNS